MDKNENGYPSGSLSGVIGNNDGNRSGCCDFCQNGGDNGSVGGTTDGMNHHCGGDGSCLDNRKLAYAYAPDQKFRMLYSAADALNHGTLFEELFKPMEVYGRE